eukprot:1179734-Prorocentrum_minimum.AAC.2
MRWGASQLKGVVWGSRAGTGGKRTMLLAYLGFLLIGLGPGTVVFLAGPARKSFLVLLTLARFVHDVAFVGMRSAAAYF